MIIYGATWPRERWAWIRGSVSPMLRGQRALGSIRVHDIIAAGTLIFFIAGDLTLGQVENGDPIASTVGPARTVRRTVHRFLKGSKGHLGSYDSVHPGLMRRDAALSARRLGV
jgi:hypothetical protein